MSIPKQFQIFGHTYYVQFIDDLLLNEDRFGDYDPDLKLIRLQPPATIIKKREVEDEAGNKSIKDVEVIITADVVMETFYHELFHCIFDAINEYSLFKNERIVGNIGEALLQVNQCILNSSDLLYEYQKK
jgi:hypothetical protein